MDNFAKNWFNFHGMKTYVKLLNNDASYEKNENMPNGIAELDSELVNKNDIRCNNELTLLDSTGDVKNSPSPECDSTFEDLGPELEWADNDVKDETLSSNVSSASGFDESEAAKGIHFVKFPCIWKNLVKFQQICVSSYDINLSFPDRPLCYFTLSICQMILLIKGEPLGGTKVKRHQATKDSV